jgi:DNA-binding Lrp family transcriptional regulator
MALQNDYSLLDDIGWKLLQALQENARRSFRELELRVGVQAPSGMRWKQSAWGA